MARAFFLLPKVQVVGPLGPERRPDYVFALGVQPGWRWMDYGRGKTSTYLADLDVTVAQRNSLIGHADVFGYPLNTNQQVGANLATLQAEYAARGIPSAWIQASMTVEEVIRETVEHFKARQRQLDDPS